jgi:hypothetical protein
MFGDGETASEVHIAFYSYEQLEGNNMDDVSLKLVELVDRVCQFDAQRSLPWVDFEVPKGSCG